MFKLFSKLSLKSRITALLMVLTVLPSLAIGLISYTTSLRAVLSLQTETLNSAANSVIAVCSSAFTEAEGLSSSLSSAYPVHMFLSGESSGTARSLSSALEVMDAFDEAVSALSCADFIDDITIFRESGKACSLKRGSFFANGEATASTLRQFDSPSTCRITCEPARGAATGSVSFLRSIWHGGRPVGLLSIVLNCDVFGGLSSSGPSMPDSFALLSPEGGFLAGANQALMQELVAMADRQDSPALPQQDYVVSRLNAQKYCLFLSDAFFGGFRIAFADPISELTAPMLVIRNSFVAALVLIPLIALVLSRRTVRRFLEPITALQQQMWLVNKNCFNIKASYSGIREVEQLYDSFNAMLIRIRFLMESLMKEQQNLRSAELKALQEQISPHFLYNSLNTIVCLAEQNKNEDVIDMVIALANYYRITLFNGMDNIPLEMELENTSLYLQLMKMHYYDILDYSLDIDDSVRRCPSFPKLTIQPLVENSLYHGVKSAGGGIIRVSARIDGDGTLHICVEDTGAGMSAEKLDELRRLLSGDVLYAETSYGLFNVNRRLRIFFEGKYGMSIRSEVGRGTAISITAQLPPQTGADINGVEEHV